MKCSDFEDYSLYYECDILIDFHFHYIYYGYMFIYIYFYNLNVNLHFFPTFMNKHFKICFILCAGFHTFLQLLYWKIKTKAYLI